MRIQHDSKWVNGKNGTLPIVVYQITTKNTNKILRKKEKFPFIGLEWLSIFVEKCVSYNVEENEPNSHIWRFLVDAAI